MTSLLYPLGRSMVLPSYLGQITVRGQTNFPAQGPLVVAPTHRSRWDGLVVGYALGRPVTHRDLRFMVSANEMRGLQGWVIRQFGGFPVDTTRASISALRHGIELLRAGKVLVIFPEGDIMRDRSVQTLKPGLARLAIQAQNSLATAMTIRVLPVAIEYGQSHPQWRCGVQVNIGVPLEVTDYLNVFNQQGASMLTTDLKHALNQLSGHRVTHEATVTATLESVFELNVSQGP
jgi:1-acyl-sn-glycerol-3-phosphate acyltransferase